MKKILIIFFINFFIVGCQGIGTLWQYSREMSAQQKEMRIQENNFKRIKTAIEKNKLSESMSAAEIKRRYKEPVVIIEEDGLKRWVYQPGEATIGIEKVYLYFEDDLLVRWEYLSEEK